MRFLPKNVAAIAECAAKEAGRFSLQGVLVTECQDDWYRIVATDGRVLAVVHGPNEGTAPPNLAEYPTARNGAAERMVPAKALAAAVKKRGAWIVLGPDAATAISGGVVQPLGIQEGRYPPWQNVLPKESPVATATVNPELVIRVMKLVASIANPDGKTDPRCELHFYKAGSPLAVTAKNERGQTADCIFMPLS